MSATARLQIPQTIFDAMIAHARREMPNECCGLLGGDPKTGLASQLYLLVNELRSPTRYRSEPRSMFEAVRDMRDRDIDIVAVYHSHPTSAPIPSKTDLAESYSTDVPNLIISLQQEKPEVRAWWLTDAEYREAEFEVIQDY